MGILSRSIRKLSRQQVRTLLYISASGLLLSILKTIAVANVVIRSIKSTQWQLTTFR